MTGRSFFVVFLNTVCAILWTLKTFNDLEVHGLDLMFVIDVICLIGWAVGLFINIYIFSRQN